MNRLNGTRFSQCLRFLFIAVLLSMLALSLFSTATPTRAATFVVNSLSDSTSGSCSTTCTLRDAMTLTASGDTITFSVSGTITLVSGTLPIVSKTLTIDGSGQTVAISGNNGTQIMALTTGEVLSLNALTLTNGFKSSSNGGAIGASTGTLNVANSTFVNNSAGGSGGAISDNGGTLNIANSTFSGNISNGGGGGAIFNTNSGTLNVTNSTFVSNTPNGVGSGVDNNSGTATLNNNIMLNGGGDCGGTVSGANNLSDGTCPGSGSATGVSGTLASNGGPTQTYALMSGSDAIDAVPSGHCLYVSSGTNPLFTNGVAISTDQRGVSRPLGPLCDIGSYEASAPTPTSTNTPTPTLTPTSTPTRTPTLTSTPTVTPTNTPVVGRIDSIGIFRSGTFYLRLHNSTGFADITVAFNPATKPYPVVGDWIGQGFDTVGTLDQNNGLFSLCNANVTATCANNSNVTTLVLGNPNDTPLSGKWTSGFTHFGVGVFRPSNGLIYLRNNLTTGFADDTMVLGIPGDTGLAGDWNGDGLDSPGVYRPSNSVFYLTDQVCNCSVTGSYQFAYGIGGDAPVIGDWIGQGHDGVGLFRQSNGFTYLKNALTTGFADNSFTYGIAGDVPVAGHYQLVYPPAANPENGVVPPVFAPTKAANPANGLGD